MPTKFVVDAFIDKQMKLCAYMPCNTPRYDAAACVTSPLNSVAPAKTRGRGGSRW
jgi:hypothetical protein